MFCSNCGKEVDTAWIKCPYCGCDLKGIQVPKESISNSQTTNQTINKDIQEQKPSLPIKEEKIGRYIFPIVIVILLVVLGLYQCGNSKGKETSNQTSENNISDEKELNNENDSSQNENAVKDRYHIGDSVKLYSESDSGELTVTLTAWGRKYGTGIDGGVIYIKYEIENTGNTEMTVDESIFDVYADDFKVDLISGENSLGVQNLSAGRKTSGTIYANTSPLGEQIIEVDCCGYLYLIWDYSFAESLVGSFTWEDGDNGANITIKWADDGSKYKYLVMEGECWSDTDRGCFHTKNIAEYEANYAYSLEQCNVEFIGAYGDDKLIVYPTTDGGILVKQVGNIENADTFAYGTVASFNGTYHSGLTERKVDVKENMEDVTEVPEPMLTILGSDGQECYLNGSVVGDYMCMMGEDYGATISIYYMSDGQCLYISGYSWHGEYEGSIIYDKVTSIDLNENKLIYDDGKGNQIQVIFLDTGEISVEQQGSFGEGDTTFEGIYEKS